MASGNEEVIDKYVDRTGFASDTKFVLENLNTIFEAYKRIAEVRIGLGNVQGLAGIVPLAKEAQKELDKITSASTKLDEQFEKNRQSTAKLTEEQRKQFAATGNIGKSYKELFVELGRLTDEQTKIAEQVAKVNDAFNKGSISQERYVEQLAELNLEQGKVAVSIDLVSKAMKNIEKSSQASAGSLDELKAQLALAKQAFDALSDADKQAGTGTELLTKIKSLDTAIKAQLSATTEVTDQQRELDKAYIESRISKQEYNKELKLEIALQNSLEGSIERARAEVKALTAERDKLNLTTEEGRIRQAELNKQIDANNDFIRENVDTLSKQKINVGNYQGSAKIIVEALSDVTKKIEELKVKQQGLQDFSKRNPIGFKKSGGQNDLDQTTAQLKQLTDQASALNNITSKPQFLNIAGKVGDTNKELGFFQQQLNALEDAGQKNSQVYKDVQTRLAQLTDQIGDTRAEIKALSSDSRSVDLFAGAVSFAADTFQTAAGAAALFGKSEEDVARITKTLIAVQSVSNGIKGITNELTTNGTAANKAYNFVLQQGTILFGKGSTAAQRFSAALKFTGIGLAIGLISSIVDKLNLFGNASEETATDVDKLTFSLDKQNRILDDNILKIDRQTRLLIANAKEQNKTQTEINAITVAGLARTASEATKTANRQVSGLKKILDTYGLVVNGAQSAQDAIDFLRNRGVTKEAELLDKALQNFKKAEDARAQIVQSNADNRAALANTRRDTDKKLLDDRLKAIDINNKAELELYKLRNQLIIEENTALAESDVLFAERRIKALEAISIAEENIITAQSEFELRKTGLTTDKIIEIRKKISQSKSFDERIDILKSFGLSPEQVVLFEKAAEDLIKVQQNLLTKSTNIQLQQSRSLLDERNRLLAEDQELLNKRAEDEAKAFQKLLANEKKNLEERLSIIKISSDRELTELNKKYSKGLISAEDFEREKRRIEAKAAKEAVKAQLEFAEKLIKPTNEKFGKDSEEVRKLIEQIDELKKKLSELEIPEPTKNFREKLENFLTELSNYASQIGSVISDALDAAATKQKNFIQDEINLIDERTAKEIESIEQTTANKEDAANRVAIVEARAAAQKRVLEQRQREIDQRKAQFDKANTIAQIILNTALAVVKAAGRSIFEAIAVGAIGAAQLAVAISTPIPRFKEGKNLDKIQSKDLYEGPAVVGDGNKSELIVRKDGSMEITPSKPTLTWLGQDDIVHPDANKVLQTTYKTTDRVLASNVTVTPMIDFEPVSNEIKSMKKEVVTAIKNKTENHFHSPNPIKLLMQKNGDGWTKYL